jgi:hypothetical protein
MNTNTSEGQTLVLQLDFPIEWRQPRNPLAESAAAWTRTYVGDFGLVEGAGQEARLDEFDPAGGSWPFYAAERPLLYTVSAFLAVSFLYREERQGSELDASHEATLVSAARGEGTRPEDKYAAAFWELGQRYAKKLSRPFLFRHGERFRGWLRAVADGPPGEDAGFAAWLLRQRQASGLLATLDFLELDLGEELAPAVWTDPRMSTIERLAAEIVALQRDLAMHARNPRAAGNLVQALQREGLAGAGAFQQAAKQHNLKVAELDRTGRALLRDHRSSGLAAWWIRLSGLVAGFGRWHAEAARRASGLSGRPLRLTLDDFEDDDFEEEAITTGVWKLPQLLAMIAAPAAG